MSSFEPNHFREVLGQYPTGVVVVTAISSTGDPLGMTVGSFTSVSLDPPLIAFLPSKTSSSWHSLREAGDRYCVNFLGADQEDVCRNVATRKEDKFRDIGWDLTEFGNPLLDGAVAHIDCIVDVIHDAGDHDIVVARVEAMEVHNSGYPLLFFRGGYGSFRPLSLASQDSALVNQLKFIDVARVHMDELAYRFDTEVAAMALVGDELVLAATSGRIRGSVTPTSVGQRLPFMPPLGSVFAAWGPTALQDIWISNAGSSISPGERDEYAKVPDRVRERGFALALGHKEVARLEHTWTRLNDNDPSITRKAFLAEVKEVSDKYNPAEFPESESYELRSLAGPVFAPDGSVAFALTAWGPMRPVSRAELDEYVDAVLQACARASAEIERAHNTPMWASHEAPGTRQDRALSTPRAE